MSVLALLAVAVRAGTYVFLGSPVYVNGTTNTASMQIATMQPPGGVFYLQNNTNLYATNYIQINVQLSLDNTNFLTVATWFPTSTNPASYVWAPTYTNQPIYMRAQAITLTNAGLSGTYQQPGL
jgi:hypothetical protein